MKINFYDEVRRIIKEELDLTDEDLKEMIQNQIKETVSSVVNRAAQKVFADERRNNLEDLVHKEVNRALQSYIGKEAIAEAIRKELPRTLAINVIYNKKEN